MKPIEFPEMNVEVAKNQPEYTTLPSYFNTKEGSLAMCYELSDEEIEVLKKTKKIWYKQLTMGGKMQPILLSVDKEVIIPFRPEMN